MPQLIKEQTAEETWKQILKHIMKKGEGFIDNKKRLCKEALNVTAVIENVKDITKPIEILNSFDKWVYPPLDEIKSAILGRTDTSGYYYNYGQRAFGYNGLNQVDDYVIPILKKNPTSKRAIVVFYGPEKDSLPLKKEASGVVMMNFNIRSGKLHTTMVIRSNDMFYGWPGNIVQAFYLADYISKELNYPLGTITTISISAHIFEKQFEHIKKVLKEK